MDTETVMNYKPILASFFSDDAIEPLWKVYLWNANGDNSLVAATYDENLAVSCAHDHDVPVIKTDDVKKIHELIGKLK